MAVFRVEKTRDYTVMANHHLKNKDLSLKSKGLLSQMLSLPEDWDYTLKGIPLLLVDLGRSAGHDLVHQIMILPYSHSPSVIKPSQAMSTARHQNGGR